MRAARMRRGSNAGGGARPSAGARCIAPPPPAGEMSPNSIPKYLKRPLWRERKWPGLAARGTGPRDRGTAARAPVARRRARPAPRGPPAPPPAFQRASLRIYSAATRSGRRALPASHAAPDYSSGNGSGLLQLFLGLICAWRS